MCWHQRWVLVAICAVLPYFPVCKSIQSQVIKLLHKRVKAYYHPNCQFNGPAAFRFRKRQKVRDMVQLDAIGGSVHVHLLHKIEAAGTHADVQNA